MTSARTTLVGVLLMAIAAFLAAGCTDSSSADERELAPIEDRGERPLKIVTTTNIITDLARGVGGDLVEVEGLMGPGIDPHLYKASAGDVTRLREADLILYGGLELEGKMDELLDELSASQNVKAVTDDIPKDQLLLVSADTDEHDPHVWFDPGVWELAAETVSGALSDVDPDNADQYADNLEAVRKDIRATERKATELLSKVPARKRVLVTSHDAFQYFGRAFDFEVSAIQGISTATEATTGDIDRIAQLVADRGLAAVFVESSVPRQTIEALIDAADARGQKTSVGGELFSDSAGDEGTPEGTWSGALLHNARTIADGLA